MQTTEEMLCTLSTILSPAEILRREILGQRKHGLTKIVWIAGLGLGAADGPLCFGLDRRPRTIQSDTGTGLLHGEARREAGGTFSQACRRGVVWRARRHAARSRAFHQRRLGTSDRCCANGRNTLREKR